ncbi:uncharacterized protein LOC109857998 [Pseudomyrmex gracilis]|uniref:uncharacterized protein LOC109857998 n=1 Tax=Pseudomyrmex gracilis TaxID=219809 RepID=UPI000995C808|nr:uncharacterized protein LOC109857998 [Pseudomyrmex gracilis]
MQSKNLSETFQIVLRKLLGITCFLLFGPFLVIILSFFYIYRRLIEIILKIQLKDKFAGILEGSDAFWSIEDISLSMVTFVMLLKKPAGSTNTIFLKNIRNFAGYASKNIPTELKKLFYYRYQKYGYFYWDKSHKFNPETAIRWLECEKNTCDGSCENFYSTTFQENLGSICNRPLYDNHKPMWEMLVGRRCSKSSSYIEEDPSLSSEDRFNTDIDEIPVVFRYHHSLGDGVTVLNTLCKIIFDKDVIKKQSSIMDFKNDISTAKELHFKEKRRTSLKRKNISNLKQVYTKIKEITKTIISILFGFEIHISQVVRSVDKSSLHGQPLTGEKLIVSYMENNANKSQLFMKLKKLKLCTGARITDIIITALAAGLVRYFSRIKERIPETLSVFTPIRMESDKNIGFRNDFSFLMIKSVFVDEDRNNISVNDTCQFFERLQRTASSNNKIRNSLDISLNYFLLKYVCGLLPVEVLKPLSTSICTIAYSNMKGTGKNYQFMKHEIKNAMPLIQNRNKIGMGVCTFTHRDKFNLSIIADAAVIKDKTLLKDIVEDTIREINSAYDSLA